MFAITERNRAQLEQFHFIQSALLAYKMLTHKGVCLQQREQILQKRSLMFSYLYIYSKLSARKGVAVFYCIVSRN